MPKAIIERKVFLMKKALSLLLALAMLLCAVPVLAETVDTYTSASATKTPVTGDALAALAPVLEAQSSTLATKAETEAEGYTAKEGTTNAQIMSVNPDGSVGLSTISEWKYVADDANGVVTIKLTYGQNALNLASVGARGTLLVKANGAACLLHLEVTDVDVLHYTAETAGQFDAHYSGAEAALDEYHITMRVLAVEQTYALIF